METRKKFTRNIGTSQGDSLSLVLFMIYLKHAQRDWQTNISPPTDKEQFLPMRHLNVLTTWTLSQWNSSKKRKYKKSSESIDSVGVDKSDFKMVSRDIKDWKKHRI
ncbi:hypothetical protein ElyMa_000140200 [Elysia marginata]|uniref:Reverse transcriptase domain-containing protein n=1 Tax=Elysia marginata TaxID=1093978 RepID=A0AAV4EQ68_9GAST|nr:hypothetical protein ElyMa_000140200 [Elysia marginata]